MKVVHYSSLFALVALLAACSSSQYATDGRSYENDDVYYQPGESFISDFAIVDDPDVTPDPAPPAVDPAQVDDEYYEEAPMAENAPLDQGVTHNYYGNVFNYGGFNSGFNTGFPPNYFAGFNNGWYNPWQPGINLVWDPYRGWNVAYNYNFGWGNYWNDPWGWNSPCFDPWFYNSWCWNSWNSPFGFYNPYGWNSPYCFNGNYWYNGFGNGYYFDGFNNGFGNANVVFGQRPSLTVGNAINSSYSNGNWNAGRLQYKPMIQQDVVEEIERIKGDYNQTIATSGTDLSADGKSRPNASSVAVGSGQRKPTSVSPAGSNNDGKVKTPPASMKNNGDDVRPITDQNGSTGNGRPVLSQPERGSRPSVGKTPSNSPRPSPSPAQRPAPRPSVSDGGKAKPSAPPAAPRRKTPGTAQSSDRSKGREDMATNGDRKASQSPAKPIQQKGPASWSKRDGNAKPPLRSSAPPTGKAPIAAPAKSSGAKPQGRGVK